MRITFDIPLSEDDVVQLTSALSCTPDELSTKLAPFGRAALEEYIRMFLGQRVFVRGSDLREYRLLLLIQSAYNNEIPSEDTVGSLFQTTPTQSRALIRTVMSKYRYELQQAIQASYTHVLQNARRINGGDYEVAINSMNILEGINRILAMRNGSLPRLIKKAGTSAIYKVNIDSYYTLCTHFNIPIQEEE